MSTEEQQKHEAAIEEWSEEALQLNEDGFYLLTRNEIDKICDLARRAPRPEPKPVDESDANRLMALIDAALASGSPVTEIAMDHAGTPCRLVLASGDGIKLVDSWVRCLIGEPATEPKPEPRASSALLAAAKAAVCMWESWHGGSEMDLLRKAVEAEEAQRQSEDIGKTIDDNSDAMHMLAKDDEIERLRRERDEARAAGDAKLRELRGIVDGNDLDTAGSVSLMVLDEIDRLLANPPANPPSSDSHGSADSVRYTCHKCMFEVDTDKPYSASWVRPNDGAEVTLFASDPSPDPRASSATTPQPNHASDDDPLQWFLCRNRYGDCSDTDRDAAIAELCRRALGER